MRFIYVRPKESHLEDTVRDLLELKVNSPEIKLIPRIDVLNEYMDQRITEVKEQIDRLSKETAHGWKELDNLFLSVLATNNRN